jgi:hypothetical protein
LRALQRRLQLWRNEQVKQLIFAATGIEIAGSETALVSQNVETTTISDEFKFE